MNIDAKVILERIHGHLESIDQWREVPSLSSWAANVLEYAYKAESLIEVLEVADCGSIGGFGQGQKYSGGRLTDRYEYLKDKYGRGI
ncbi:MAG: hypothetical protein GY941_12010 [Planctomycetes bacterium]|nr:hypothetical protein [Planctomycetota bacterium]